MTLATPYSALWDGPTLLHKGSAQTVRVSVEHDGAAATLTSPTFSLFDGRGTTILDDVAASFSAGTFSYTIGSTVLDSYTLGPGFHLRFKGLDGDSEPHSFGNDAALCLTRLYPPIGTTSLTNAYSRLGNLQAGGSSQPLQKFITRAWADLTGRLYSGGLPFWRMRTPSALREWMMARSLSYALDDLALTLGNNTSYREEARRLEKQLPGLYNAIRSRMDVAEDNQPTRQQSPAAGMLVISGSRQRGGRRRR